ncbi:MAG: CPBP family intramembrane glutamic endopeptidase [Prosthecobacter sp.]
MIDWVVYWRDLESENGRPQAQCQDDKRLIKGAIWLSALIFALSHLNPWQGVVALTLGLLFGWLVLRTGSLAPGIIGHFVVNCTNTKLMLPACALFGHSPEVIKEATHLPWDVVSAGAVLSVVGIGWLWSELRLPRPSLG